jgi:hypothetical protein
LGLNRSWAYGLLAIWGGSSRETGVVSWKLGAARAANPKPITAAQNRARASTIRRVGMADRGRL